MLDEENYSSDSSDDDYVPTAESDVEDGVDEEDHSSGSTDADSKKNLRTNSKRERTTGKKTCKSICSLNKKGSDDGSRKDVGLCRDGDKQHLENLWASFKETAPSTKQVLPLSSVEKHMTQSMHEFTGEQAQISSGNNTVPSICSESSAVKRSYLPRTGGLLNLTSNLSNKKFKLSTLEKSKLDWDQFKNDEGISEELKTFNQGKQGFLERQAFLERADFKQFEAERRLRAGRKSK